MDKGNKDHIIEELQHIVCLEEDLECLNVAIKRMENDRTRALHQLGKQKRELKALVSRLMVYDERADPNVS